MKYSFLLITVLFFSIASAQETTAPSELFEEGQYFFARKDFKEALYYFKMLVETDTENAHFNFKVGECYLNIPGQEHMAVIYLEKSSKKTVPKREYRSKSFSEKSAPLHSLYYLGNAYRMDGQLNLALRAYNKFIDSPYFHNNYNLTIVENEIKSCEIAKIIQDSPIDVIKTVVPEPISSSFSEFNPVLSHDGKKMVFIRELKFYNAVFVSNLDNGKWTTPVNISPEIGSDGDFYPTGMNTDGTVILFTREKDGRSDIYSSEFQGNTWSKAQKLSGRINSSANETFASFGENDATIYLVSDRQGGRGKKDLWVSRRNSDAGWSKAKNLGKVVNTEHDEETPVMCRKEYTLFFSSKGHYNMGGFDIFYASLSNQEWSDPRNVGYPLNTTRDDLFYNVMPECNKGYYSIIDSKTGIADIYLIEVNSVLVIPEQK